MSPGLWQSALVAAATAALVTYALEYAAKPWLEVRKARILDEARAFREIQTGLKCILMLMSTSRQEHLVKHAPDRVAEDLQEVRNIVRDIQKQLAYVRPARVQGTLAKTLSLVIGRFDAAGLLGLDALEQQLPLEDRMRAMSVEPEFHSALLVVSDFILTPRSKPIRRFCHGRRLRDAYEAIRVSVQEPDSSEADD